MALAAVISEFAAMDIVPSVAAAAIACQIARIAGPAMAGRADKADMFSSQGKVGLQIVIEPPGFPIDCVVTVTAGCRIAQCPHVVFVLVA